MAASARITPAPLPSLPTAFSRRAALFGAVTATGFLGAAAASATATPAPTLSAEGDPLVDLYRRHRALIAVADSTTDDAAGERAAAAALDLQDQAFQLRPTTLPAAVAALAWAREEFGRYYVESGRVVDWSDRWTLAMLDGALGVFRGQVAGAAA